MSLCPCKNHITFQIQLLRGVKGQSPFFIPADIKFCEWLVSCVKDVFPLDMFDDFQNQIGRGKMAVIHFPTQNKLASVAFGIWDYAGGQKTLRLVGSHEVKWCFYHDITKNRDCNIDDIMEINPQRADTFDGNWYLKLISGLILYCGAFPEALKDGLPEDLKHPSHHQHEFVQNVELTPKVLVESSGSHSSPTAHYRIGHFRSLRDERYVRKRYQTIFVHGTFVKGRAQTVLPPEEVRSGE